MYSVDDYIQTYLHTAFWRVHGTQNGFFLLLLAAFFPRITTWFSLSWPFGPLAWVGWFIAPHLTMAVFAYLLYWKTNPELCVFAALATLASSKIDLEKRAADKCLKAIKEDWDDIRPLVVATGQIIVAAVIALIAIWGILKLILGIPTTNAIGITVPLIFATGWALYSLRRKHRSIFGALEIISALILGGYSIAHAVNFQFVSVDELRKRSDFFAILLGLLSSVYIVVRGLDNLGAESVVRMTWPKIESAVEKFSRKRQRGGPS